MQCSPQKMHLQILSTTKWIYHNNKSSYQYTCRKPTASAPVSRISHFPFWLNPMQSFQFSHAAFSMQNWWQPIVPVPFTPEITVSRRASCQWWWCEWMRMDAKCKRPINGIEYFIELILEQKLSIWISSANVSQLNWINVEIVVADRKSTNILRKWKMVWHTTRLQHLVHVEIGVNC